MMQRLPDPGRAASLFGDWPEAILWSCLQNVMGAVYVDDVSVPRSAIAVLGDFLFLAGKPEAALLRAYPAKGGELLIPQNEAWSRAILQVFGDRAVLHTRYAIQKEPSVFDRVRLHAFVRALPEGYDLQPIGSVLYRQCLAAEWSRDLTAQFPDGAAFRARGLGFAALREGRIVSGAASYAIYRGGIEIEIDTHPDFRRMGLAQACGARLILECLDRGLYPSWDAHDLRSVALAESLGYRLDHPYPAFELNA